MLMRKLGALLLGVFVLLLSVKSNIGMHFCHGTLVEASINESLSSCCTKTTHANQPTLNKQCCEIAHFTAELTETVLTGNDVEFHDCPSLILEDSFVFHFIKTVPELQTFDFESPPEPSHISLHILFEQYLI